jgi:hypothetical protein
LYLVLTAEAENNNGSPADMFLQLQCRMDLIFFLKICQVLTNDAGGPDSLSIGITKLLYFLFVVVSGDTAAGHTFVLHF